LNLKIDSLNSLENKFNACICFVLHCIYLNLNRLAKLTQGISLTRIFALPCSALLCDALLCYELHCSAMRYS